jgi:hypothetical protein
VVPDVYEKAEQVSGVGSLIVAFLSLTSAASLPAW